MNNVFDNINELINFNTNLNIGVGKLSTSKNFIFFITSPQKKTEIYGELLKNPELFGHECQMFGLRPEYGAEKIKELMFQNENGYSPYSSYETFNEYINTHDNINDFGSIPKIDVATRRGLWGRILLNSSRFFVTPLRFSSLIQLQYYAPIISKILKDYVNIEPDTENYILKITGRIPDKCLLELDRSIGIRYKKHGIYIGSRALYTDKWSSLYESKNKNYTFPKTPALYSGVIPNLVHISFQNTNKIANENVEYIKFECTKTTYFTMDGLENNLLNNHPFLSNYKTSLSDNDKNELLLEQTCIENLRVSSSINEMIQVLNCYLSKSTSLHNVNVSGNFISKDSYCVYTKRQERMYDSNKYYCSVNGICEFMDDNVELYSIPNIDKPTIEQNCKYFSFIKELERETDAELNIAAKYNCLGFSIMGNISKTDQDKFLPLFFNIIGKTTTTYTLDEIAQLQKLAQEEFENKKVQGIKFTKIDFNLSDKLADKIKIFSNWLFEKTPQNIIEVIAVIGLLLSNNPNLSSDDLASLCFGIACIAIIFKYCFLYIKYKRNKKIIFLFRANINKLSNIVEKMIPKRHGRKNIDPILMLLTMIFILTSCKKVSAPK